MDMESLRKYTDFNLVPVDYLTTVDDESKKYV